MGNLNFDASTVSPHQDQFEPLPAGWYHAHVVAAELLTGKKPDAGEMLKLQFEINGNEHPKCGGRRVFTYLCINHKQDSTRNIAKRMLSAIAHAIGQLDLASSDQLLGEALMVRLKIRPAHDGYDASNDVAGFTATGSEKTMEAPGVSPPSSTDNQPSIAQANVGMRAWK